MKVSDNTERIVNRLDELITLGEKVIQSSTRHYDQSMVDSDLFQQWYTSSRSLLLSLPENNIFSEDFMHYCTQRSRNDTELGVAILRSAKEDIERGLLNEWTNLVSAEVFDDLLEQAEHLLDNKYKDPAASLIGAILENELRHICKDNDIPVKSDDNIGSLNQKLFQKSVYGKPQMRQIGIWQAIRDSADHGKFEDYNVEAVKNMLEGVRNFLSSQLD